MPSLSSSRRSSVCNDDSVLTNDVSTQGIITSQARQHNFPTPLCSTAEQIYLSALLHGYGPKDDSAMVRQYYATPIADVQGDRKSVV